MIPGLLIYVYILLGILVFFLDAGNSKNIKYDKVFNAVFVIIALVAALSYDLGTDTIRYMHYYDSVPEISKLSIIDFLTTRYEPLFVLLNSLCRSLWDDYLLLQIVQTFLLYHSLYLFLKKYDLRKFWVLFLFFGYCFLALHSGKRECFGLSCCLYAFLFYSENKWVPYYVLVTCGFLFHTGMFIFYILPFVKYLRNLKNFGWVILFAVLFFSTYLFRYIQLLDPVVNEDASILQYELEEDGQLKLSTAILNVTQLLIVFIFALRTKKKYTDYRLDFIYFGVILISFGFLSPSLPILYRYNSHLAVFLYFTIQECMRNVNLKMNLLKALIFIVFAYSPISIFSYGMKFPSVNYYYCSIFASQQDKNAIDAAHMEIANISLR